MAVNSPMERVPGDVVEPLKLWAKQNGLDWQAVFAAALLLGAAFLVARGFRETVTEIGELRKGARKTARREVEQRIEPVQREAEEEARLNAFNSMLADLAAKIPMENRAA